VDLIVPEIVAPHLSDEDQYMTLLKHILDGILPESILSAMHLVEGPGLGNKHFLIGETSDRREESSRNGSPFSGMEAISQPGHIPLDGSLRVGELYISLDSEANPSAFATEKQHSEGLWRKRTGPYP
jgi:hypothetical protein